MKSRSAGYPDISDIHARKAAGRRKRVTLSFAQKLDILDSLRKRVEPLVQARKNRAARRSRRAPQQQI
jgi:hypothetical protein